MNFCPVCINDYDSTIYLPQITRCGHVLCSKCISYLKNVTNKCSICRQIVDYNDVIMVFILINNDKIDKSNISSNNKVNTWTKRTSYLYPDGKYTKFSKLINNTNITFQSVIHIDYNNKFELSLKYDNGDYDNYTIVKKVKIRIGI